MMFLTPLALVIAAAAALPYDPVIRKLDDGLRYQYEAGPDGSPRLVDTWLKASDLQNSARFDADATIEYHLFTRDNDQVSQMITLGNTASVVSSNFDATKKIVCIVHGWMDHVTSDINTVLVPAILTTADVNVIVIDWKVGSGMDAYLTAVGNVGAAGVSISRFVTFLNTAAGITASSYHFIGHGLGGHVVGVAGRNLGGQVPYITVLDPSLLGFLINSNKFDENDGIYTECIHTNSGMYAYMLPLAKADFYPNSGINMPGCNGQTCDHHRAFHFMGESITTGGFTGTRCPNYISALTGFCFLSGNLKMGGLEPKTGMVGIYHLTTNSAPPFSRY